MVLGYAVSPLHLGPVALEWWFLAVRGAASPEAGIAVVGKGCG